MPGVHLVATLRRPTHKAAILIVYAVLTAGCAIAIPWLFLASDPWQDGSRFIRSQSQPGDLVVIVPAARLDRLAAFTGLWVVAADRVSSDQIEIFPRIFWVEETNISPPAGLTLLATRRFGKVSVQLLSRALPVAPAVGRADRSP